MKWNQLWSEFNEGHLPRQNGFSHWKGLVEHLEHEP